MRSPPYDCFYFKWLENKRVPRGNGVAFHEIGFEPFAFGKGKLFRKAAVFEETDRNVVRLFRRLDGTADDSGPRGVGERGKHRVVFSDDAASDSDRIERGVELESALRNKSGANPEAAGVDAVGRTPERFLRAVGENFHAAAAVADSADHAGADGVVAEFPETVVASDRGVFPFASEGDPLRGETEMFDFVIRAVPARSGVTMSQKLSPAL